MDSEYIYALQSWYLAKYTDLLKIIAYIGGCIPQQQLCRLLYKGKTKSKACEALVKKLVDSKLLKIEKLGTNNILIITHPVIRFLNLNGRVNINSFRYKTATLIIEKYLRNKIYEAENPVSELLKKIEKTSAYFFKPPGEAHMRQLNAIEKAFKKRGWSTDGIVYQYKRAEKRFEHAFRSEYKNHFLDLNKEPDLFTLECKNIYLTGVYESQNQYGKTILEAEVDMYYVSDLPSDKMASYIIEAKRVIEDTLQNDCVATIDIYCHNARNKDYEEKVYQHLEQYPEYVLPDVAKEQVKFHFFNTFRSLFGSINPNTIR